MNVLDLFSGIGGFSLGLERAGMKTVAFCEIEPFQRAVLAERWPGVPCFEDVRILSAQHLTSAGIAVDLISGGFPCQDISLTGRGAGLNGRRSGLWHEFARLIGEIQPSWVIIENVSALRARGLDVVLGGLDTLGYDAEWHCIPASAIGAPHRRDRVWIVAYPHGRGWREQGHVCRSLGYAEAGQPECSGEAASWWATEPDVGRVVDGLPAAVDRRKRLIALGNAVVPQIPEILGRAIMRQHGGTQ